jgi:urease accessory protein
MIASAALLRLLQLASPSLPIGAYSYSQGLESAIDEGTVTDAASAQRWIAAQLLEVVGRFDAPLQWRLLCAFAARDAVAATYWSERWLAARDTAELRAETVQMGYSLRQLLAALLEERPDTDPALLAMLDAAAQA